MPTYLVFLIILDIMIPNQDLILIEALLCLLEENRKVYGTLFVDGRKQIKSDRERAKRMDIYEYGNNRASVVLIEMVGEHNLPGIEQEIMEIRRLTDMDFRFIAVKVNNWNQDLSPWNAEAVFGTEEFGNGARDTLDEVLKLCTDTSKYYCIGGYSMAGLFALWTAMQTNQFDGIAAASPSIWFPGFLEYMKRQKVQSDCIYLSLGDKEEKTRNAVMAQVGNCIRQAYAWLAEEGIQCTLEWNQGGHFKEPDIRTARAFAWVMNNLTRK